MKKKKTSLVAIVITVLVLIIIGLLIKYRFYNSIASQVKDIPGLNKIFVLDDNPYMNLTKEELIKEIEILKAKVNSLELEKEGQAKEKEQLLQKIDGLSEYEQNYTQFVLDKNAWDAQIAQSNPTLYIQHFEKIYPDQANQIYKELKQKEVLTKEQREYAKVIGEMDEEQAALALEKIIPTDPELIKIIFDGMERERQALILSSMTTQSAAQVIKIISPGL